MVQMTENEAEALFGQNIYKKREVQICVPYSETDFEIKKKYGEQGIFHSTWMLQDSRAYIYWQLAAEW